jgi:hypothetical protein
MLKLKETAVLCLAAAVLVAASAGLGAEAPRAELPLGSPNAILCARVKNLDQGIQALAGLVTVFDEGAGQEMKNEIEQGFQDLPGVERKAPAALLLLDPKKFDEPVVGVFTLKDANAFKEVRTAQVVVVGSLGVIAEDEAALAEVAQEIKAAKLNAIPTADMAEMAVGNADLGAILTRYQQDMQAGLQLLKMQMGGGMGGMQPDAPQPTPTQQMGLRAIDQLAVFLKAMEKQVHTARLGVDLDTERIVSHFALSATPNTDFAAFLKKNNRPAMLALASYLPRDAFVTSVSAYDPDSVGTLAVGLIEVACHIAGVADAEKASVTAVVRKAMRNATGVSATANVPGKQAAGGVSLYGIRDKQVARTVTAEFAKLTQQGALGDFFKKYGLGVKVTEVHRDYGDLPIDRIEMLVDINVLANALPIPPEGKMMMTQQLKQMMKMNYGHEDRIELEIIYGKRLAATAYGAECRRLMNRQIDLMKARGADGIGNTPAYKAAMARHPKNATAYWHMSLFGYVDLFSKVMAQQAAAQPGMGPGMNMFPTRSELPPNETPITGSVRIEGNTAVTRVDVPVKPIAEVVAAVKRKMEKMMQEMMRNMQPPPGGP